MQRIIGAITTTTSTSKSNTWHNGFKRICVRLFDWLEIAKQWKRNHFHWRYRYKKHERWRQEDAEEVEDEQTIGNKMKTISQCQNQLKSFYALSENHISASCNWWPVGRKNWIAQKPADNSNNNNRNTGIWSIDSMAKGSSKGMWYERVDYKKTERASPQV